MAYGRATVAVLCLVLLGGLLGPELAQAQIFDIKDTSWARQYTGPGNRNDFPIGIGVDSDGNVYVGGHSRGDTSGFDYTVVKYDSNGNEMWVQLYDGPGNSTDSATAFWLDQAANVYLTGASISAGTGFDYATVKYDKDGNLLWERRFSATVQTDVATDLFVDDAGNVFVTGHSRGIGTGQDYLTIKYDAAGNILWQHRFNSFGLELDTALCIAVDDSGNVYVSGTSPISGQLGDIVTLKYNATGSLLWTKRFDGSGQGHDRPYDIAVTSNGDICVVGSAWGAGTRDDFVTLMYASDGTLLWHDIYNGTGGWYDVARLVRPDDAGNVYVSGNSDSPFPYYDDITTIKYDAAGTQLWVQRYESPIDGDDAVPYDAQVVSDGSIWIGGFGDSVLVDFTALHYTPDGDLKQVRRFFVAEFTEDFGSSIAIDDEGYIYMTGTTRPTGGTTNFSTVKFKPCWCPFQVDKDEDGFLTAVDLSGLIDVAFFGTVNLKDQGCPIERYDFDCSGEVDALDLNDMINHLFFGGPGPCAPCEDL
jgi:hypothetical protein